MNRALPLLMLLVIGGALWLRCPELAERPLHNDEAVNAIKFRDLWEKGQYRYDPNEHHGPTLFYATLAWTRLTSAPTFAQMGEARFRMVTVIFGIGLLLLLPLVADGLGRGGTAMAAVLTAVSPALVFYSRYYIHEMLLAFFTLLALGAAWRYHVRPGLKWALLAGAALGLMQATKETFVLTLAAFAGALVCNHLWLRWTRVPTPPWLHTDPASASHSERRRIAGIAVTDIVAGLGMSLVVAVLLFSSFFTNASGPLDSLRTYAPWVNRAAGASPHLHPWNYYFEHLLWFHPRKGPVFSEALIALLALVGGLSGFRRVPLSGANPALLRVLASYTLLLAGMYSGLAYKTPWCLLSFWHSAILLAGVGAVTLWRSAKSIPAKAFLGLGIAAGVGHLAWQAGQLNTNYATNRRNPYIYSQTSASLLELVDQVKAVAQTTAAGDHLLLKVMAPESDYWPLPWYLRQFDQVGYYGNLPADPSAPIMIVAAKLNAELDEQKTHLMVGIFELRPQVFLQLYVAKDVWRDYLAKRPRPSE